MSVQIDQKAPNLKVSKWVQGMDTNLDKQNDNVVVVENTYDVCPFFKYRMRYVFLLNITCDC